MYVKHITDFMRQQLHENKAHKIYLVKGSHEVVEGHRTVTYYDIREANLLDKARMNLPTESSLRARANANIELSCALENMRKQEIVAIQNDEIDSRVSFAKMGVQYLTRKDFVNTSVNPRERASQLTGVNLKDLTENQWLRFEKIERFLHFVQKGRHLPGASGDNVSLSGMSTASGVHNWEEAMRTGESWRLFVIRNDEHFVASERAARRNATVHLNPETLEVLADVDCGERADKSAFDAEEARLKATIPDELTRRGRSVAISHGSRQAFISERKRAVLELEDAAVKQKDLEAEDVIVKKEPAKRLSPANVGGKALQAKSMHFNEMASNMNDFLDTALHETRTYLEKTSTEPKLPIGPGKFSAAVKYDDKPAAPHNIVGADEHKIPVSIPHAMVDHIHKPAVANQVVVYATIEHVEPEVKKPTTPTKLADVMASPLYASIDLGEPLDEAAPGYETIGSKKAPKASATPVNEDLYSYVTVQDSPNRIKFITEEEETAEYVNINKDGDKAASMYAQVEKVIGEAPKKERTPPPVAAKPKLKVPPELPPKEPPPKPIRVDSLIKTPENPAV